ncbi:MULTISPECIES: hypothetical protein [Actinomadura]|uniref:Peptidase MA superfamily protein n=1 Tax=Actinomadura yumaensis TaxID=111807 RepID=A0ABW2CX31_9ACTN|nr:hypothetical protein [Actinomadura sp. J1-007]MWK32914.1 hypothetical protein [Actinomadura sp. J1-007]
MANDADGPRPRTGTDRPEGGAAPSASPAEPSPAPKAPEVAEGSGGGARLTRRRALLLGSAGAAACVAAGAGLAAARSDRSGRSGSRPASASPAVPFEPGPARVVLANRSRAVREGDRAAFLATVGSAPAAFQAAQARVFDNLRALPLESWEERLVRVESAAPDGGADAGAGTAVVRLELRYRLRGFDRGQVARTRYLAFAPRSGAWGIVGDGARRGLTDDPDIWDGGMLRAVRGRSCLVAGDAGDLDEIARRLDAAVPAVTSVLGRGWARRAVALVPADPARASALAGEGQDLHEIAALAAVAPAAGGGRGEDRIIIAPATFGRLNALGRDVVLTHELTHVATGGARDGRTPLWLIEGFADYVGYRGAKVDARTAAGELRREVAAGRLPSALPGAAAFDAGSGRLSQAYQESWLACRMIADRYGETALVRLYRAAGRAGEAAALRDVLGLTPGRLTALWRDHLTKELG